MSYKFLDDKKAVKYWPEVARLKRLSTDLATRIFASACSDALLEQWVRASDIRLEPRLQLSKATPCPCRLVGWKGEKNKDYHFDCEQAPGWDHAQMWNVKGKHALITYASYELDVGALVGFCWDHNLLAGIIPNGWYFPNVAIQVVIGSEEGFDLAGRKPSFAKNGK